jgi:RES domain
MQRPLRDSQLIDPLEAHAAQPFHDTIWRVVRDGHEPTLCSASGGRWDDGTFDVLYTSRDPDGAIAEMYFHLKRGHSLPKCDTSSMS